MRRKHGPALALVLAFVLAIGLAACDSDDGADETTTSAAPTTTSAATTTTAAETTTTTVPEPEEPELEVPFLALWEGSGHADATAEAFRHWDEDDPAAVPASCAKCHSDYGFKDFVGADGSAFGAVDAENFPTDSVITCTTCHNEATLHLDSVVMPSGVEITGLGSEAICMQCHQGRESGVSIDEAVAAAAVDEDTVSEDLRFLNIHYYAAAATKYGTEAMGGYQYEGKTYDAFFDHVEGYSTCADCHNTHSLELKVEECSTCHAGVATAEDTRNIRMVSSGVDYDGDGDMTEGIAFEIEGLQEILLSAIEAYAADVVGATISYDAAQYPYFLGDDGGFASWTPRLLKAAYNYQLSLKDPGAYAHNGKYVIQLLVDSIEDLNTALPTPVAAEAINRIDHGHFAGSEEAFRHWDEDGEVSASCSKCHSAEGLPLFLEQGVTINQPTSNGFLCSTCHADLMTFERYPSEEVAFPSGATATLDDPDANLCMNCHQGRESGASVVRLTEGLDDDTVSENLRFLNVHYFAAGATLLGNEVGGGFEYPGQTYTGRFEHVDNFNTCVECHDAHTQEVEVEACGGCHGGVESAEDLATIRMRPDDFDGDGDTTEGIAGEVETMAEALLTAMQEYATETVGAELTYDPNRYPYFFGADGGYNQWTPRLLRAAYNYQYAAKDPGGFAHNGTYIMEILYDSLVDIGGDVTGMTRP